MMTLLAFIAEIIWFHWLFDSKCVRWYEVNLLSQKAYSGALFPLLFEGEELAAL